MYDLSVVAVQFFGLVGSDCEASPLRCLVFVNGASSLSSFTIVVCVLQLWVDLMLGMYVLLDFSVCVFVFRHPGMFSIVQAHLFVSRRPGS